MPEKKYPVGHAPTTSEISSPLEPPRFVLGVAELPAGACCSRCTKPLETAREVRAFEQLAPLCDLCSLEHGPPWLVRLLVAAAEERLRRTTRPEHLERLLAEKLIHRDPQQELVPGEVEDVVWILLRLCPPAVEAVAEHLGILQLERLLDAGERRPQDETEASVLEMLDTALELAPQESRRAAEIAAEIGELGLADATARLRSLEPGFKTPALYHQLAEASWGLLRRVPQRARELAELAVVALEKLEGELLGRETLADLEADAWARLGNARRVACDLHAADEAFAKAWLAYERGSLLPLRKAEILDFLGSLRRDQRRFDEALVCLERALEVYRLYRDHGRVAKVLNLQASVFMELSKPERAVALVRQAISLIDGEQEPRLLFLCYHNLLTYLLESKKYPEAERLLPAVAAQEKAVGEHLDNVRLTWLRGRIAHGLQRYGEAEMSYLASQQQFMELDAACDAAVVSLDLASCYLEQNRGKALVRLAASILPIFESRGIHREAIAALELFRRGLEANELTKSFLAELKRYLRRARHDPELRFTEYETCETSEG